MPSRETKLSTSLASSCRTSKKVMDRVPSRARSCFPSGGMRVESFRSRQILFKSGMCILIVAMSSCASKSLSARGAISSCNTVKLTQRSCAAMSAIWKGRLSRPVVLEGVCASAQRLLSAVQRLAGLKGAKRDSARQRGKWGAESIKIAVNQNTFLCDPAAGTLASNWWTTCMRFVGIISHSRATSPKQLETREGSRLPVVSRPSAGFEVVVST